jgi:hypothetical protein
VAVAAAVAAAVAVAVADTTFGAVPAAIGAVEPFDPHAATAVRLKTSAVAASRRDPL